MTQALPEEVYANEEVAMKTYVIHAQNNKLKKLPKSLSELQNLQRVDIQNNVIGKKIYIQFTSDSSYSYITNSYNLYKLKMQLHSLIAQLLPVLNPF